MTKVIIGQSPVHHVEDLTLVDGKASFTHRLSKINRVTFDLQHVGDIIPIPYAFEDNGGAFTDESSDARNTTDNDVNLLPAAPAEDDAFYYGANDKFKRIIMLDGTDGAGVWTITWEYWDGDGWTTIVPTAVSKDFTDVSDEIRIVVPSDWEKFVVNSTYAYWLRARVSAYTSITTRPQVKSITLELDNKQEWARSEQLLEEFTVVGDATAVVNMPRLADIPLIEYKVDGNVAVGTVLAGMDASFDGQVTRVEMSFATNGVTGDNYVDVNVAGTTIFTTQGNRPTLAHDATDGLTSIARVIEAGTFNADQRITIDIDEVSTGTAPTDLHLIVYGRYAPYNEAEGEITKVIVSAATVGTDDITSLQYCRVYDASEEAFVDEDASAAEATDNDVELFVSPPTAGDMVNYGCDVPFYAITHVDGTDASALVATIVWQYYNGTAWTTLTTSATSNDYSDISDVIYFEPPGDWALTTVDTQSAYWIRSNMTAFTSVTTEPQAKSIQLGISAVLDVNVGGTSVYTIQGARAVLHDITNNDIGEINGGRIDAQGVPSSSGIVDGRFTRNQIISVDIDYAAPSTGVEPVDLMVQVYGALFDADVIEKMSWKSPSKKMSIWSDNLKSNTKVRVIVEGY